MLRLAHAGTLLPLVLGFTVACSEARTEDAGQGGRSGDGARDVLDAGAGTGGKAAYDAAVRGNLDGGCAPLPCPSGATWSPSGCACVIREPEGHDPECSVDSDCVLTPRGCCFPCAPAKVDAYLAVPRHKQSDAAKAQCPNRPVACGPCADVPHDPLAQIPHSACVNRRCAVVDLRSLPLSRCATDADCIPVGHGCCGAYSGDPREYVGVDEDAGLEILQCVPAPPCLPPREHVDPISFCAQDGHCAVRGRERASGVESATCYSPTQNLDRAYEPAAVGCDCSPNPGVCKSDSTGRRVGLICLDGGTWQAVEDGPCGLGP